MGPKDTIFNSDECQCLLDVFDRLLRDNWTRRDGKTIDMFLDTEEEKTAFAKIEVAGKFYVPIQT